MNDLVSNYITGFQKIHTSQYCLFWKNALHKGDCVYALFMDLSKAFDTIKHDLLLAKLEAYSLSKDV